MKTLKIVFLTISIFITCNVFACDTPQVAAFKAIPLDGAAIVFDFVSIEKESSNTSHSHEIGIDVIFFRCSDGTKTLIGQLPYLADTGKIEDAFLYGTDNGTAEGLFVIHSVEIRSDTGVNYSGRYYTINVYKKDGDNFTRNEQLSTYFGKGGDIFDEDYKELLYIFPYKNKISILRSLKSEAYKKWRAGAPVNLVINKKTAIHNSPVLADVTRMYLLAGDVVSQSEVEAGWLSVIYKTSKGKEVRGWIQCENADGC